MKSIPRLERELREEIQRLDAKYEELKARLDKAEHTAGSLARAISDEQLATGTIAYDIE